MCEKKVCGRFKTILALWIDEQCKTTRKKLMSNGDLYHDVKTYRSCVQREKRKYKRDILKKLESKCNLNSIEFWKILNSLLSACNPTCVNYYSKEVCTKVKEMSNIPHHEYVYVDFENYVE